MEIRCKVRRILCALLIVLAMVAAKPLYAQDDTAPALTDEENLVEQDNAESQESGESQEEASTSPQASQTEVPPKPMAGDDVLLQNVSAPEASIFTGTAITRIPIKTPPARSVSPKIGLTYNSSRNNSWVGVGWDLRMGAVQRSTKRGLHYDDKDFIVLTGESSFELVENPSWLGCAECYGAKIEDSFTWYQRVLSPTELVEPAADGSWIATAKDGTKYYYGSTDSSRQGNGYGTFKWLLDRIEDTAGNYATIGYAKEDGEVYLERIDYTANGALQPTNYVLFHTRGQGRRSHFVHDLQRRQDGREAEDGGSPRDGQRRRPAHKQV